MYLSSPRVNIAEESVVDHRVQLQCKFDEKEGKYTEAKPRCTCPSYESNLHQVGEVQHLLPLDLMLVHFRPHLCSGYTDQYHSFLQKVKSSMITEQNGILTPTPHPCPAVLVSPTTRVVPLPPQLLPLPTFLPLMATSTSSDPTSDSSSKSLIFHSSKIGPTISSDIADYVTLLSDV